MVETNSNKHADTVTRQTRGLLSACVLRTTARVSQRRRRAAPRLLGWPAAARQPPRRRALRGSAVRTAQRRPPPRAPNTVTPGCRTEGGIVGGTSTPSIKFLEYTPFDSINLFPEQLNLGDCTIRGNLEAFSCKHTATDRRLSISLEHEILDYLGKSSDSDPSPVEHLSSRSSRKTLIYLALTLGHMYPDYDFSAVRAHLFFQEEELESFRQMVDTYLSDASRQWAATNEGSSLLDSMTKAIDEVIKIRECDIYSYNPDSDADPVLEKGAIWSFNYFFYNKTLKRVVSFRCYCTSKLSDDFLTGTGSDGEEEDALIDMDI